MIAVVSGASGFIGSHLVDELLQRKFTVRCLLRPSSNTRWLENKRVDLCETSLSDQERLNVFCRDANYIIHCAGSIAARSREDYITVNKGGTEHMLRAALATASSLKRFVQLSSMTACGPAPSLDRPLDSTSECHPITSYGISKLEAEKVVRNASERIPVTIIRPPVVYGERDEATVSFFRMIRYHIAPLMGLREKWISMIHVSDLVRGIADAMMSEATLGRTYFLSDESPTTWNQISGIAARIMKKRILKVKFPHAVVLAVAGMSGLLSRLSHKSAVFNYEKGIDFIQPHWICRTDESKTDFNFKTQLQLREGLERTITWYQREGWL